VEKDSFDPQRDLELLLCLTPGIGGSHLIRILHQIDVSHISPEEFLCLSEEALCQEFGFPSLSASVWVHQQEELKQKVVTYWSLVGRKPVRLVTMRNPLYPKRLEEFCPDAPGFLFFYGNSRVLETRTFCVLASRDISNSELDLVERTAEEGILVPQTLVTGTNTPAYQRSAVVPLRWGSPRVLVLDRGLFDALGKDLSREPFPAARLWRYRFDPVTDLVVSAHRPFDGFVRGNNERRDEIVAGLSDEVRVVRARRGGVTERLALRAQQVGRRVVWLTQQGEGVLEE
jgi:DNA processing protein